ncbi:MAG TPA: hypothetical protein VNX21_02105 [Candidatus Thermoplasmatota archaeon]|nr:hypothetical protein [Candidatus Thermoplasmatota archaeon]
MKLRTLALGTLMLTAALAVPAMLGTVGIDAPELARDAAAGPEHCLVGYSEYNNGDVHQESCLIARPIPPA